MITVQKVMYTYAKALDNKNSPLVRGFPLLTYLYKNFIVHIHWVKNC